MRLPRTFEAHIILHDSLSALGLGLAAQFFRVFFFPLSFWNEAVSCYILEVFNLLLSGAHS